MKKRFLYSFLFSAFVVLLLNFIYGTYFEKYDPILNVFTIGETCEPISFTFFISTWFYIFPFFSLFNKIFNSAYGYSFITSTLNVSILSVILFCTYIIVVKNGLSKWVKWLVLTAIILIFIENIIYIQNPRISFFSLIAAYLLVLVVNQFKLNKSYYLCVFFLCIIGIFTRLEIAVITSIILLVFSLLFQRKTLRFSTVLLILSVTMFVFYKTYQHYVYPEYETILQVEHVFEDQEAIYPSDASDYRTQLKLRAIRNYIRDDDVYSITDVKRIISQKSFTEYLCSKKFSAIYIKKLQELASLLRPYRWFAFLILVLSAFCLTIYARNKNDYKIPLIKASLLFLFTVGLILVLNAIIIVPHNFILCVWTAICILCLFYLTTQIDNQASITPFLIGYLMLQMPLTIVHLHNVYVFERSRQESATEYKAMLIELNAEGKTIVLANGIDDRYFPSRLFSPLIQKRIKYYCADFFLSRYPFFANHNRKFFGEGYSRMSSKMSTIASHSNAVWLSNAQYCYFITEYMKEFHNMEVKFEKVETKCTSYDVIPYRVIAYKLVDGK